jgi:hypothetical protein
MAKGYRLDNRGPGAGFPTGTRGSLHHSIQTGAEARTASYLMGIGRSLAEDKETGAQS